MAQAIVSNFYLNLLMRLLLQLLSCENVFSLAANIAIWKNTIEV
jgi:hypothetical protein